MKQKLEPYNFYRDYSDRIGYTTSRYIDIDADGTTRENWYSKDFTEYTGEKNNLNHYIEFYATKDYKDVVYIEWKPRKEKLILNFYLDGSQSYIISRIGKKEEIIKIDDKYEAINYINQHKGEWEYIENQ